jgi:hypothetical protein
MLPAAPAVGPAPASRDSISLATFSISVVHGPAAAVPTGKSANAQIPHSNPAIFICFLTIATSRLSMPYFDSNHLKRLRFSFVADKIFGAAHDFSRRRPSGGWGAIL